MPTTPICTARRSYLVRYAVVEGRRLTIAARGRPDREIQSFIPPALPSRKRYNAFTSFTTTHRASSRPAATCYRRSSMFHALPLCVILWREIEHDAMYSSLTPGRRTCQEPRLTCRVCASPSGGSSTTLLRRERITRSLMGCTKPSSTSMRGRGG